MAQYSESIDGNRAMTGGKEVKDPDRRPAQTPDEESNLASKFKDALREAGISESEEASRRFLIRVSRALRSLRRLLGANQERVAEAAELTQNYVSKLESGKMSRGPTLDVLVRYANALGCDVQLSFTDRRTGEVELTVSSATESKQSEADEAVAQGDVHRDLQELFWVHRASPVQIRQAPQPELHGFEADATKADMLHALRLMSHGFSKPILIVAKPGFGYSPLRDDEVVIGEIKPASRPFARQLSHSSRRK